MLPITDSGKNYILHEKTEEETVKVFMKVGKFGQSTVGHALFASLQLRRDLLDVLSEILIHFGNTYFIWYQPEVFATYALTNAYDAEKSRLV